ncbi:hypothetical protein PV325_001667 [Microctonus aethiopoides]|uniref:Uncharacterized protein n=1 Tax=Microctonus aethiopoides TaxID=144406 RepID=A0AA39EZG7_9HYME|nr:hypothetical protein PV325_001667 [Microctonus aethiopoides]KAK0098848.1 hypothetical protein PV326_001414 [Microctonus aethiopoides]KAK0160682.1 hypothetical protein PV328_008067 [Microctonus aethiopoides]
MATDVEESDTEDHERPAPAKRKCVKIINISNENGEQSVHQPVEQSSTDSERLARETLLYQRYQIDKECYMGSLDNTINRVMETYILTSPSERTQLRLFREAEMEDRAVMMAIHNHGLVNSNEMSANSCVTNNHHWFNDDQLNYSNPTNNSGELSSESNDSNSETATSANIFATKTFQQIDEKLKHNWTSVDKTDDSDQQQDILERAVAEAIKIKGLSALSVDYG